MSAARARLHVWTIGDRQTASTRLRVHQYLPRLAADGVEARVRRIPKGSSPGSGCGPPSAPGTGS